MPFSEQGVLLFFSHSVLSDFLQPHGLQNARLQCPSTSLKASSNSCPLSRWCHPTILSFVFLFSTCLYSFTAQGPFLMSRLSAKVLELQHQSFQWIFRISFLRIDSFDHIVVHETLKSFLHHHSLKTWVPWCSAIVMVQHSHPYLSTGKTIALLYGPFSAK